MEGISSGFWWVPAFDMGEGLVANLECQTLQIAQSLSLEFLLVCFQNSSFWYPVSTHLVGPGTLYHQLVWLHDCLPQAMKCLARFQGASAAKACRPWVCRTVLRLHNHGSHLLRMHNVCGTSGSICGLILSNAVSKTCLTWSSVLFGVC